MVGGDQKCEFAFNLFSTVSYPFFCYQNAPSNFQTVLVATDIEEEDIAVNLDIAREFAREHQLPLLEVNLTTGGKTDDAFSAIVEKIMQVYGKYRPSMVGKYLDFRLQTDLIQNSQLVLLHDCCRLYKLFFIKINVYHKL